MWNVKNITIFIIFVDIQMYKRKNDFYLLFLYSNKPQEAENKIWILYNTPFFFLIWV